jgi:hypothetical protein
MATWISRLEEGVLRRRRAAGWGRTKKKGGWQQWQVETERGHKGE